MNDTNWTEPLKGIAWRVCSAVCAAAVVWAALP